MTGGVSALFRYPIKGFTPQAAGRVDLTPGRGFPGDRLFAVEDGPSGFRADQPAWISKMRFTVLAKIAEVARARTDYDLATGRLRASAPGAADLEVSLARPEGREAFAAWLAALLGDAAAGPLQVLEGAGHRFFDHPEGHVSVLNLASVRDLGGRLGRPVDPLRFRANVHVDGWPAWAENAWTGRDMALGAARVRVFAPITRCAAPNVDPATAERDMDVTAALHQHFGHLLCGIYVHVIAPGDVGPGDAADLLAAART